MKSVMAALHPDVVAHPLIGGGPLPESRAAVAEWWQGRASQGGEVEARPLDYEVRDSYVIVRGYLRQREGTTLSESQVFWLLEIEGGQMVRMETHQSREAALASCWARASSASLTSSSARTLCSRRTE